MYICTSDALCQMMRITNILNMVTRLVCNLETRRFMETSASMNNPAWISRHLSKILTGADLSFLSHLQPKT